MQFQAKDSRRRRQSVWNTTANDPAEKKPTTTRTAFHLPTLSASASPQPQVDPRHNGIFNRYRHFRLLLQEQQHISGGRDQMRFTPPAGTLFPPLLDEINETTCKFEQRLWESSNVNCAIVKEFSVKNINKKQEKVSFSLRKQIHQKCVLCRAGKEP